MKITRLSAKNIIDLSPRLLRRMGLLAKGPTALELLNLRPAAGLVGEQPDFMPVGEPRLNNRAACWTPIERTRTADGDGLLMKNGTLLAAVPDAAADPAEFAADAGSEVLCALSPAGADTIVMTEAGPRTLSGTGTGAPELSASAPDYPAVVLRAVAGAPVQATVGARKLSRAYTSGQSLTDADNRALVADYVDAYRALTVDAASAGCYLQPVLARYRLLDAAGRVVFESAPTLLSHPEGQTCTGSQPLYSADGATVDGYTLTARSWTLMVETAPCSDSRVTAIAAVEVLATPQFHPYNPRMSCEVTTGRLGSASTPWAHVALPCRSDGLTSLGSDAARRKVMRAIARMDVLQQRMAYLHTPFTTAGVAQQPVCAAGADPAADAVALSAGLRSTVAPTPYERVLLSPPHTFSARHCCAGGATVAWANLTIHRYQGYHAACFAATTRSASGNCLVTVRFKGMQGVIRHEAFTSLAPADFGPVLCYPSPDATEMTISITIDGVTRRKVFSLTPDESGRWSVYVEPSLGHIVLPVVSVGGVVSLREPSEAYPGVVAIAESTSPLTVRAYTAVTGGEVRGLISRNPAESSWEFGRERFLALCSDRVVSAGADTSSWRTSLRMLLPTGVASADAAVQVGSDTWVLTGGRLLRIGARGAVSTVDNCTEARMLAYDTAHAEVLAIGTGTKARVYCPAHGNCYYHRTVPAISATAQIADRCYGVTDSGLAMLDSESFARPVQVSYICAAAATARVPRRISWLRVAAAGRDVEAAVELGSADANGAPRAHICTFNLAGPLVAPLSAAIGSAPVRVARINFSGKVTADFRLSAIQLVAE